MNIEYHVSKSGSDLNDGTLEHPFLTINRAAKAAKPGDTVTVHSGTYREWVTPTFGGISASCRIIYSAAEGEKVIIKGSDELKEWKSEERGCWSCEVNNAVFGDYNPYADEIAGDWFDSLGRVNHSGEVYLDEAPLNEAISLDALFESESGWFAVVGEDITKIYAKFGGKNPNEESVEFNVRRACFFPLTNGIDYITVRGFTLMHAATQWAPPTSEQIGLIGPNWSRGWIIENNTIAYSKCVGISLGKERATGHNFAIEYRRKAGFNYQLEAVFKALQRGWSKDTVGSHTVRYNKIYGCEQAGIVGHLGCVFSEIYGNDIYDINKRKIFSGAEIAGIKFHGAIDCVIHNNRIHSSTLGIWLDWQNQGSRLYSNLLYNNDEDLFIEVCHGPCLLDNNLFLSAGGIKLYEQGLAAVNNVFAGRIYLQPVPNRSTPYHFPHSTAILGAEKIFSGDDRILNNVFIMPSPEDRMKKASGNGESATLGKSSYGTGVFEEFSETEEEYFDGVAKLGRQFGVGTVSSFEGVMQPVELDANVYYAGAQPCKREKNFAVSTLPSPVLAIEERADGVYIIWRADEALKKPRINQASTQTLGRVRIAEAEFETPSGEPITLNKDYFGSVYEKRCCAGAFDFAKDGVKELRVWKF